jgi:hypothetical protein
MGCSGFYDGPEPSAAPDQVLAFPPIHESCDLAVSVPPKVFRPRGWPANGQIIRVYCCGSENPIAVSHLVYRRWVEHAFQACITAVSSWIAL